MNRAAAPSSAKTPIMIRKLVAGAQYAIGDGEELQSLIEHGSAAANSLRSQLPGLLERANKNLAAIEELTLRAEKVVDPNEVEPLLRDLRTTMTHLQEAALDARQVMGTIRRGQGTVGGLATDPQLYDDLKEMVRDIKRNPWKLFWRD